MTPENEKQEFQATSVEEYRKAKSKHIAVTLPSGSKFIVRRLSPLDYIREGLADIPNEFVQFISEVSTGKTSPTAGDPEELEKNYKLFDEFLRITLEQGVISPPIIMRYDKDKTKTHLIFGELDMDDQAKLVNVIVGREQSE